jgi:hypothetical protein
MSCAALLQERSFSAASRRRWCNASPPARRMMAPARESGTASAAVGGALCAAATWGAPLPLLLPPGGVAVATELGDMLLAALGGERIPLGFSGAGAAGAAAGAAGLESVVAPFDLVPVEDEEDIGAWSESGRG